MDKDKLLRENLKNLLLQQGAHVSFSHAVKNIPFDDLGKKPDNVPYSLWQQVEHMRIAQKDILDYSKDDDYRELNWPEEYWPKEDKPASEEAWNSCIKNFEEDLQAMVDLVTNEENDLFRPFAHGASEHNLLREAVLLADHNAYHVGQIVVIRKSLGNWQI